MAQYSVKLSKLVESYHLEILRRGSDYESRLVTTQDVNRPGLPLTGYFKHFDPKRIQVIGNVEHGYLESLSSNQRREVMRQILEHDIPALVITRGLDPFPETMELAEEFDRTILGTRETTSAIMGTLITALRNELCPRVTRHGVLLEIYGEGVLLYGDSGVGKSETAIELIKRGHRLIADDAVEIKRMSDYQLVGSAPELIRHYMELRGIGVVDVRRLFGVAAIKEEAAIDLVINLEPWRADATYDRLGLEELETDILDVKVPTVTIPVSPGRNLAVVIEVAAMNNRYKKLGYNAARAFTEQINSHLDALESGDQE